MADKQFHVMISIGVEGEHPSQDVTRYYGGDYDTLHNTDWNKTARDFLDDVTGYLDKNERGGVIHESDIIRDDNGDEIEQ